MGVVLLGLGGLLYWSRVREARLASLQWVVSATRQLRDDSARLNKPSEEAAMATVAEALADGVGSIALKVDVGVDRKKAAREAAMVASGDDHLGRIGVFPGAANYWPTKSALYWLAGKMS